MIPIRRKVKVGTGGGGTVTPGIAIPNTIFGYAQVGGCTGGDPNNVVTATNYDQLKTYLTDNVSRTIIVEGQINGTSATTNYGYYCQGNKTILGKPGAIFNGFGLWWYPTAFGTEDDNVIIRNIKFQNMPNFPAAGQPLRDYLTFKEGASKIWVDHCDFDYQPGLDGQLDTANDSDGVTISHCIFRDHSRATLMGGNKTTNLTADNIRSTLAFNWFLNCTERQPSFSIGRLHLHNNLYESTTTTNTSGYGLGVRRTAQAHTSNNVFQNFKMHPLRIFTSDLIDDGGPNDNGVNVWPAGGITGESTNLYINSGTNQLTGNNPTGWAPSYSYSGWTLPTADVSAYVKANAGNKMTLAQLGL